MGRPTKVEVSEVVEFVHELGEPVTVAEVAEAFDCGTTTAREKLRLACDMGDLREKRAGPQVLVFWPDDCK